jgi:hypothetical protein
MQLSTWACLPAEMPPNVTVTLKGRRTQQHASLGHLTKVMQSLNGVEEPLQPSSSSPSAVKPEPGTAQDAHIEASGGQRQRRPKDGQPPPQRRRPPSAMLLERQHRQGRHEQPHLATPAARLHRAAEAAAAEAAPTTHKRHRSEEASAAVMEPVQRKLRRKGDIPKRLAAILQNECSPSNSEVRLNWQTCSTGRMGEIISHMECGGRGDLIDGHAP